MRDRCSMSAGPFLFLARRRLEPVRADRDKSGGPAPKVKHNPLALAPVEHRRADVAPRHSPAMAWSVSGPIPLSPPSLIHEFFGQA